MRRRRVWRAQPEISQLPTHELIRYVNQSVYAIVRAASCKASYPGQGWIVLDWEESKWRLVPLDEPIERHGGWEGREKWGVK